MLKLLGLLLIGCLLEADERWLTVRSGPFQVLSDASDKVTREQMNQLEQFRYAFGNAIGKPEATLLWPLRVVVTKKAAASAKIELARDAYLTTATDSGSLSPEQLRELGRLLLDQNTARLPADVENGLLDLFSTVQITGTHITLGEPPAQRSRDWARMQLLSVNPDYAGRSRVMISNLEQGSDLDVAYKNAFQKTAAQIEAQVDAYVAAGKFATAQVSGRPLSPSRDLHVLKADPVDLKLAMADLAPSAAVYNALHGPEAAEGLGWLALREEKKDEAKRLFASALESGTKNARAWYAAALLETDKAKARKSLEKAVELNPRWAAPHFELARLDTDLDRKASELKKAAALDPRNVEYWQALAKNETEASRFPEAQKAWGGAERAAANPAEREQIRQVRLRLQAARADYESSERRRKAEEEARDLERVKNESMASIHQAEAAANKKLNPDGSAAPKAVEWWSGPESGGQVEGLLQRVDCTRKQARLAVVAGTGKTVRVTVRDPRQSGLTCGVQTPQRKVLVRFTPKADQRTGTVGEAVSIEFR